MKKLLFLLLLFPLLGFGQQIIYQDLIGNFPAKVGDTFTVRFYLSDQTGSEDVNLLQIDISYNNKKILPIGTYRVDPVLDGQSKSANYWSNYLFTPNSGFDVNDLDGQKSVGLDYTGNEPDWNIARYTIQSTIDIGGAWIEQDFSVQDISGTNYTDYTGAFKYNWAHAGLRTGGSSDISANTYSVDLNATNYVPAGTVTFQLDLTNIANPTDYRIYIEPLENRNSSTPDYSLNVSGPIDISGKFVTTELSQDVVYVVNAFINNTYDPETNTSAYPTWLDDVVTVSDVVLAFKQVIGTNPDGTGNTLVYNLQKQFANVVRDSPDNPLDFDDSYALLAHLAGILDNGASGQGTENSPFYPITSFNNGAFNYSSLSSGYGTSPTSEEEGLAQSSFTLTDNQPVTFNVSSGLMGDVDLSHSNIPDGGKASNLLAKAGVTAKETADVDITTQLVDNTVELTVDISKQDLSGLQLYLRYDKEILVIKDIKFDTGNTMTNFAKKLDGKLIVGTIDPQAKSTMKTGTPIKIVFETKQVINNTAGLVSFYVTDAVKKDGTKVNLNLR